MTHKEIIEANRLLAEFIGAKTIGKNHYEFKDLSIFKPKDMKYDTSWAWIMQVVEKIESIKVDNVHLFEVHIYGWDCRIIDRYGDVIIEYEHERKKIEAVYYACVDFVKLYKENKAVQEN